jgi:hypothetical protein
MGICPDYLDPPSLPLLRLGEDRRPGYYYTSILIDCPKNESASIEGFPINNFTCTDIFSKNRSKNPIPRLLFDGTADFGRTPQAVPKPPAVLLSLPHVGRSAQRGRGADRPCIGPVSRPERRNSSRRLQPSSRISYRDQFGNGTWNRWIEWMTCHGGKTSAHVGGQCQVVRKRANPNEPVGCIWLHLNAAFRGEIPRRIQLIQPDRIGNSQP